jgi:hypothetical protein
MNQHNVSENVKTYDPSLTEKQNEIQTSAKTYDPSLISKQHNVPQEGIYNWKPLYYAFVKRCEIIEGLQCLQTKLYNLSK